MARAMTGPMADVVSYSSIARNRTREARNIKEDTEGVRNRASW
jgi:hypothetical protein